MEGRTPVEYPKTGAKRGTWVHQPVSTITTPANGRNTHGGYLRSMILDEANVVESVLMECPIYHPKGFSGRSTTSASVLSGLS